jgi:hypothetical protein
MSACLYVHVCKLGPVIRGVFAGVEIRKKLREVLHGVVGV